MKNFSSIEEFLEASENFENSICRAPTSANWIQRTMDQELLKTFLSFANSAYPIIHESVLILCYEFLKIKKTCGTKQEQSLYNQLTIIDLIDRLILKVRCNYLVIYKIIIVVSIISFKYNETAFCFRDHYLSIVVMIKPN